MSNDAIVLLKQDHKDVKAMFRRFEQIKDGDASEVASLVDECIHALLVHAKLEEAIFYPAARKAIDDDDMLLEADEEHHVAEVLIDELRSMSPDDEHYPAKFTVLSEMVKHHIDEEESELFPKVRDALGRNRLQEIGEQMQARRPQIEDEVRAPARAG